MVSKSHHDQSLDTLVTHLELIDEHPEDIDWIMREGIWLPNKTKDYNIFPDLILVYDSYAIPVELKSTLYKGNHHKAQLRAGEEFIHTRLHLNSPYGIIARYDHNNPHSISRYRRLRD